MARTSTSKGITRDAIRTEHHTLVLDAETTVTLMAVNDKIVDIQVNPCLAATARPTVAITGRQVALTFAAAITDKVFVSISTKL